MNARGGRAALGSSAARWSRAGGGRRDRRLAKAISSTALRLAMLGRSRAPSPGRRKRAGARRRHPLTEDSSPIRQALRTGEAVPRRALPARCAGDVDRDPRATDRRRRGLHPRRRDEDRRQRPRSARSATARSATWTSPARSSSSSTMGARSSSSTARAASCWGLRKAARPRLVRQRGPGRRPAGARLAFAPGLGRGRRARAWRRSRTRGRAAHDRLAQRGAPRSGRADQLRPAIGEDVTERGPRPRWRSWPDHDRLTGSPNRTPRGAGPPRPRARAAQGGCSRAPVLRPRQLQARQRLPGHHAGDAAAGGRPPGGELTPAATILARQGGDEFLLSSPAG